MYKNLSQYIARLEQAGELKRVPVRVDPIYEIAELTDRESKKEGGGSALLFENTGSSFPVLTNMMGSDRRIALALGVESVDQLRERINTLLGSVVSPKDSLWDRMRMLPLLGEMSQWLPVKKRGRGECAQVVLRGADARLDRLPILKCWTYDAAPFVTLPLVNTVDPVSGARNVGMYRMQVMDNQTTGMHWHLHKTGERHYRQYQHLGQRMPVSVCLGGDPAYTYAATAPMPDNMDEYLLAGFIRRKAVELVKCVTNDIWVPSDCDFVIEGYVDPSEEKVVEGPFGDHTGFYSLEDLYPRFHVTAITHRKNAVYPATIVGVPPQEDAYIAKATEKIFLEPIRFAMLPEVEDLYMPVEGAAHNIAILSLRKSYAGQGFKAAHSMWGAGQMMFNKFMIIAPSGGDIRSVEQLRELIVHAKIPQDIILSQGPLDVLDHCSPEKGFGGKMAIDLTGVDPDGEISEVKLPSQFALSEGILRVDRSLAESWRTLIIIGTESHGSVKKIDMDEFFARNEIQGIKYVLIADHFIDPAQAGDMVWYAAGNCDPWRDISIRGEMLVIDARIKIGYSNGYEGRMPNAVASSIQTIELVNSRWSEYGLSESGGMIPSPSLKYIKMQRGNSAEYEKE